MSHDRFSCFLYAREGLNRLGHRPDKSDSHYHCPRGWNWIFSPSSQLANSSGIRNALSRALWRISRKFGRQQLISVLSSSPQLGGEMDILGGIEGEARESRAKPESKARSA